MDVVPCFLKRGYPIAIFYYRALSGIVAGQSEANIAIEELEQVAQVMGAAHNALSRIQSIPNAVPSRRSGH